jgi:hypothetical protein
MTKEQILDNAFADAGMEDAKREITTKPHRAVLAAMDEYAKQEMINLIRNISTQKGASVLES